MKLRIPFLAEIVDKFSRENFKHLDRTLYGMDLLKGQFVFFEKHLSATSYPSEVVIQHDLGFIPQDIIMTSVINSKTATVYWLYAKFTKTTITVEINEAVAVRFFLGRFEQ